MIGHRGHASGQSAASPCAWIVHPASKVVCARRSLVLQCFSVPSVREMRFFTSSLERALSCEEAADPTPVELGRVLDHYAAPLWLLRNRPRLLFHPSTSSHAPPGALLSFFLGCPSRLWPCASYSLYPRAAAPARASNGIASPSAGQRVGCGDRSAGCRRARTPESIWASWPYRTVCVPYRSFCARADGPNMAEAPDTPLDFREGMVSPAARRRQFFFNVAYVKQPPNNRKVHVPRRKYRSYISSSGFPVLLRVGFR